MGPSSRTGPCAPPKICSPLALASTSGCSRICPGAHGRTTIRALRDGVTCRRPWPPFLGCSPRSSRLPSPPIRPCAARTPARTRLPKGDEDAGVWTEKSRRALVLTPDQVRLFQRACRGRQPQDLIFTAPGGGAWYSGCFFAHRWRPVLDTANAVGLTGRSRVHDLCHTHASWLIARKAALPVVQGRVGHESITTTADRYGHLLDSADDEVVAAVEWAMGRSDTGGGPRRGGPTLPCGRPSPDRRRS
ncbi:tyrosine-type recombinase/integrase [Streptomyces sp. LNU-CPARS28]|uniref:tyrosine-type recombinase/integrase n=1 Tax=Streptomyces sp. LNU-CPARS28 TaxID=3137371 RepID=UPI004054F704